jgi:tetratricopeptide (TPR) repeat protein
MLGDIDDAAKGWHGISTMFVCKYITRDPWRAYETSVEASMRFTRIGDARLLTLADVLLGATLVDMGAYEEAEVILHGALRMSERGQIFAPRGDAKRWLGHCAQGLGRLDDALRLEENAENEIRNQMIYRGAARAARAWALAELGSLDEAAERCRIAIHDLTLAPSHQAQALAWLARIELRRGRIDAALLAAQQAHAFMKGLGALGSGEATLYVALVEVFEAMGNKDKARSKLAAGREAVRTRAEKILDAKYRASFMERIPDHVWLMSHEVT